MKLLVYKTTNDRQLGHLYEHIVLGGLSGRLRKKGFLSFLDYDISGEVSKCGVVSLDLKFKNYVADEINNFINNASVDFSDDDIASATLQIFAEKCVDSDGFEDNVVDQLKKLDVKKWEILSGSKSMSIDLGKIKYDGCLNLYPVAKDNFFEDNIRFCYPLRESDFSEMIVFYYLSRILINSTSEMLENDYHAFCTNVQDKVQNGTFVTSAVLRISKRQGKDRNEKTKSIKEIIDLMKTEVVVNRMIDDFIDLLKSGELIENAGDLLGCFKDAKNIKNIKSRIDKCFLRDVLRKTRFDIITENS